MKTGIVERAAFRDFSNFSGALSELDHEQFSNVEKVIINARNFAGKVATKLKRVA